jgi:hypothetical protein
VIAYIASTRNMLGGAMRTDPPTAASLSVLCWESDLSLGDVESFRMRNRMRKSDLSLVDVRENVMRNTSI